MVLDIILLVLFFFLFVLWVDTVTVDGSFYTVHISLDSRTECSLCDRRSSSVEVSTKTQESFKRS